MERLCFGTFIDVLIQCKKQKITKTKLTGTVIKAVDPKTTYLDSKNPSAQRSLNHLYKCTGDFSPTHSDIKNLLEKVQREAVIQQFEDNITKLIDNDKYPQLVLALCDIIKKDSTLRNNGENVEKFRKYFEKDINDLLNQKEYILSVFLVNIFLYTATEIPNKDGKEWLTEIAKKHKHYEEFFKALVDSFKNTEETIHVWETIDQSKQNASHITSISQSNCQDSVTSNSAIKHQISAGSQLNSRKSMLDEFNQAFEGYAIQNFINSDPNNSLTADRIGDAHTFATHIFYIDQHSDISDKNNSIYPNIISFINILWEYIGFLKRTSKDPQIFPENYKPLDGNDNNFMLGINDYRQKLNSLSAKISKEIDNNRNKYAEEKRSLHEDISKYYEQDIYSHKLIE